MNFADALWIGKWVALGAVLIVPGVWLMSWADKRDRVLLYGAGTLMLVIGAFGTPLGILIESMVRAARAAYGD